MRPVTRRERSLRSASSVVACHWPCTNRHVQEVSSLATSGHIRVSGGLSLLVLFANCEEMKGKKARLMDFRLQCNQGLGLCLILQELAGNALLSVQETA